jgi:tetratricopeptide (TPR) repeat protein
MAGGVFGMLPGEEVENSRDDVASADARADGTAISIAMDEARYSPLLARKAAHFLEEQTRLMRMQCAGLVEEQDLKVAYLHYQLHESRLRRVGHRVRIAMQVVAALVATAVGLGVVVMLYDAFTSKSVIVEPFDAPADLAARGLTGKVIATELLDDLTRLQAATRDNSVKRNLSNAWTNDIRVAMPQTGVSIGDIDRLLKARFGHDQHIDGDLVLTASGGVALSVRGDGVAPKTFSGVADELDKLSQQAAEYVYGQAEPSLFAMYLMESDRIGEVAAFSRAAYGIVAKADRPQLLNTWANAIESTGGSLDDALLLYREALQLKPNYWEVYNNIMNVDLIRGDEEGVWQVGQEMRKVAGGRPGRARESSYQNLDLVTWNLQAWKAAIDEDTEAHGGLGSAPLAAWPELAEIDIRLHDAAGAALVLETARSDVGGPEIVAMSHFIRGRLAMESADSQKAASEMEAFGAAYADPTISSNYAGYNCWIAPAEEAAGHPEKADAVLSTGGHFVDCLRFRGDILDRRGDWPGAQRAYADAVALAPDLPAGYYSWGAALARHGELNAAETKLAEANRRGPHWADPLRIWGDVLAQEKRWAEARAKYDAAARYAPAWSRLLQAEEAALPSGS